MRGAAEEAVSGHCRRLSVITIALALCAGIWWYAGRDNTEGKEVQHGLAALPDASSTHLPVASTQRVYRSQPQPALFSPSYRLMDDLADLDVSMSFSLHDPASRRLLDLLFQQGGDALPAIQDYLLASAARTAAVDSDLRLALIGMLRHIDDPRAADVALDAVRETREPMEIYLLSRVVRDWVGPGWQDGELIRAVDLALQQLFLEEREAEAGPLLQLLGELGDSRSLAQLASVPQHLEQAAYIAMAHLPDGSGIPLLQDIVANDGADTSQGRLAIRLLCQAAVAHPDAARALEALTADGRVPQDMWPELLELIKGEKQLQLVAESTDRADRETIFHPQGEEVWYRVKGGPVQDRQRYRALLERLGDMTSDREVRRLFAKAVES